VNSTTKNFDDYMHIFARRQKQHENDLKMLLNEPAKSLNQPVIE